ncbi:MAG: LPS export ABC transporter permease LptG [Pseudomonadales bacterium]|nr:LPS export ABC transporter permease LptG [Gammaproteobacteria bacterium]NNL56954.1 LPS export ABC transporter permease LptG [Pseudomonadales bacterium]
MSKLGRYISTIVGGSILLVLFLVLGLDIIAAIIDELGELREDYTFIQAVYYVLLTIPGSVNEYVPLAALIGSLAGMGLLASNSELIVMRASGLSLVKLAEYTCRPVLVIIVLSMLLGEYIAPVTDKWAKTHKDLRMWGSSVSLVSGRTGLWHREGDTFMHFNVVQPGGVLYGVTIFEFERSKLQRARAARRATYQNQQWLLEDVRDTVFGQAEIVTATSKVEYWQNELTPSSLAFLVNEPSELAMQSLLDYSQYLSAQGLDTGPYQLAFWQKCLQPLAVFSLVLIALSFVFGPLRSATMGFRVFIGIVVGITFQFAQNLLGPASLIYGFPPLLAVLLPIALCALAGVMMLQHAR